MSADSFYAMKTTTLAGQPADLAQYNGKVALVVNVASQCGLTPQYAGLQKLYDELKDKAPEAGRKSDPNTGGGYANNVSDDKKGPKFALPGNKPAPPFWIMESEKEPFDDSKYKAGDEVPGILVAPFRGDRGDIAAKHAWKDGVRTIVISRKLVTTGEFDVQFKDLKKEYAFGVAVFDNAQVRHAYNTGVLKLRFE